MSMSNEQQDQQRSDPGLDPDHGDDHDHGHGGHDQGHGGHDHGDHDHDHGGHDHGDHDHDHGGHDHGDHDHDSAAVEHEASMERVGSRVIMEMTIGAEEVSAALDEVARAFRQQAKLQGFRRGKAPLAMIKQKFAEEIRENVLDRLIPLHLGHEIKARDLKPIHNPRLDDVDFSAGAPLKIKVHFDVEPEVEVGGYKNLDATRAVKPVSDEAVEKAVSSMREQAAKLESVDEGGIELGDYVIAKITLFPRDGKGKKLAEEERFVRVGEEQAIPALNTQLEGQEKGGVREFVTELGASYPNDLLAGKEVTCRVEVQDVKRRHLPPVDDELARDLGFADLEELRVKMRDNYNERMEEEADREVTRQLMDQVIAANRIDTPESLVDVRLDQSMQRAAEDLARQGIDPRDSVDWAGYRADNRPHAERAVTEEILLDGIASAEGLEVDDADVLAEIESHHEGQPEGTGARLARQMRKDGSFEALRRAMLRRRALDFVKSHATIENVEASPEPDAG